jgi:alkaline phosphatase D
VEFIAPAVTPPVIDDPVQAAGLAALLWQTHPHVKYVDLNRRGYVLLDITRKRVHAEWYHIASIARRTPEEMLAATFQVRAGENHVMPAPAPTLPRRDAPALAPDTAPTA